MQFIDSKEFYGVLIGQLFFNFLTTFLSKHANFLPSLFSTFFGKLSTFSRFIFSKIPAFLPPFFFSIFSNGNRFYLALKQSKNKQRQTDKQAIKRVRGRHLRLFTTFGFLALFVCFFVCHHT